MNPIKITFGLFVLDAAIIAAMALMISGCLSVTVNINVAGKQEPINTVDTPYRSVLPWIDAGGDVTSEGDADTSGEVVVPLTPPEMPDTLLYDEHGSVLNLGSPRPLIEDIKVPE